MNEIWKDVINYEGFYIVSNLGNVKSLDRITISKAKSKRFVKGKKLKLPKDSKGYPVVSLSKKGNVKVRKVHQLVAESFLKHNRKNRDLIINHIDFNPSNNKLINLELVTYRENGNKKHLNSSSKYTGVMWHKRLNKWYSSIHHNGKTKYLGVYVDEIEASKSYQKELLTIKNQSKCILKK